MQSTDASPTPPGSNAVGEAYGRVAQQYIDLFGSIADVHADDLAIITEHLSVPTGPVLDVGCGPGHLTAHLCSSGVVAVGVDHVPGFIEHARSTHPEGRFELASMDRLPVPDACVVGLLAWYSLIHVPPDELDGVLVELRRVMAPGGTAVVGFVDNGDGVEGGEVAAFDHKVARAHAWPVDELAARLRRAGFGEVGRVRRTGVAEPGRRPHAALVCVAH
jgi:SAM-dependent methyltransferase